MAWDPTPPKASAKLPIRRTVLSIRSAESRGSGRMYAGQRGRDLPQIQPGLPGQLLLETLFVSRLSDGADLCFVVPLVLIHRARRKGEEDLLRICRGWDGHALSKTQD